MDDESRRVDSLVRDLERTIGDIDRRLTEVERTVASLAHVSGGTDRPARTALSAPPAIPAPPALPALPGWLLPDPVTLLAFVGRTFVALGGAFSLRALTDASVLPLAQGSALGLAYGLGWLVMSDRAAAVNRRTSAVFHGLVAVSVLVLRKRRPDLERPYKCWGYPWVPIVFILVCVVMTVAYIADNPRATLPWLGIHALGFPAY